MSNRLGGIVGCKYKTSSPMVVTLSQQYNIGERPTVMPYTYINRYAKTSHTNQIKTLLVHNKIPGRLIIIYRNSAIEPYTIRASSLEHKRCNNIAIGKEKYIYILQVRWDILLRL